MFERGMVCKKALTFLSFDATLLRALLAGSSSSRARFPGSRASARGKGGREESSRRYHWELSTFQIGQASRASFLFTRHAGGSQPFNIPADWKPVFPSDTLLYYLIYIG